MLTVTMIVVIIIIILSSCSLIQRNSALHLELERLFSLQEAASLISCAKLFS